MPAETIKKKRRVAEEIAQANPKEAAGPKDPETATPKKAAETKQEKKPLSDVAFHANLDRLKAILDIIRGKENLQNRLDAILNPKNLQTSSKLSASQVDVVSDAYWLYLEYPNLYKPLKDLADEMSASNLSLEGFGIEKSIQLTGAIEQSKFFKEMLGSTQETKRRFPSFRKTETKQ